MSDQQTVNFSSKGFQQNWLRLMALREKFEKCCKEWITKVHTQNSATIIFNGDGTLKFPLTATALGGGAGASGSPAGANNDIQFNENGAFTAATGIFTYNPSTKEFTTPNLTSGNDSFAYANTSATADNFSVGGGTLSYGNTGMSFSADSNGFTYATALNTFGIGQHAFIFTDNTYPNSNLTFDAQQGCFAINRTTGSGFELYIGPGTSTYAPIGLTAGTLNTTPQDGAFEYDGTHLYFTIGITRHTLI